ncbi:MAG: hypothetical protein ACREUG_11145, partial [Steroidobacteraceae bacterium]
MAMNPEPKPAESPSSDALLDAGATVHYRWRYDAAYYGAAIERYYQQLPRILHLPVQFTIAWLIGVLYSLTTHARIGNILGWAAVTGAVGIPGAVFLTRQGIRLKYRHRSSFGTEAEFFLSKSGIRISQKSLNGHYPWAIYARAVRFADGILLLKRGAMRWLPDSALQSGTVDEALALVHATLPT